MVLRQRFIACLCLMASVIFSTGCEQEAAEPSTSDLPKVEPIGSVNQVDPAQDAATRSAWMQGDAILADVLTAQNKMHEALEIFLAEPETGTLETLRQAWRETHTHWHQLDPFLGLADSNPALFSGLKRLVFSIDAQPLQPGYLDYLEHYPYSGIVNDISLSINARALRTQHGLTDVSDVSLGLHALEFLLWGENGQRPPEDFYAAEQTNTEQREAGFTIADLPNNRRRDLVLLLSHLLRDDLHNLQAHWQEQDSWLYQTYYRLHPASRVQLLKNTAWHYLDQTVPQALSAQENTESAHNRFASRSEEPLLSGLKGLQELLSEGETPLSQWLGEPEQTEEWLTELASLTDQLEQLTHDESPSEEAREQLQEQVRQLAEFLKPADAGL